MGLISRRFKFLENLFPPGGALPPQPGFFEESVSPVHQILNGTDRLGEWIQFSASSAAGVSVIIAGAPDDNKYFFLFACGCSHNDPVAREMNIFMRNQSGIGAQAIATTSRAVPTNARISVPRAFIVPPRIQVSAEVDAIAAGQQIKLDFIYMELDLGEPAPPCP